VADSGLPEQLGFSREQFLGMSLHPAFDGLMPAGHAAAAAVYLAAVAADDYHGESVDGYTLLERAGLIRATNLPAETIPASEPAPGSATLAEARDLSRALESVLQTTEDEFNQFPLFARPMARSGFKRKAGQSVQDWRRAMAQFSELIDHTMAGDQEARIRLTAERAPMGHRLQQLAGYFEAVPGETARFTRDEEMLSTVSRLMAARVDLVQRLRHALAG
jgi:hypothetical protein